MRTGACQIALYARAQSTQEPTVLPILHTHRLYVHSSIYDEFASRLAEEVEKFKVGNGFDEGVTHGPLIHSKAVDKTHAHVEDAKAKGAKVLLGGKKATELGENFYEPTILTDVQSCAIDNEETFGAWSGGYLCFTIAVGADALPFSRARAAHHRSQSYRPRCGAVQVRE